MLSLLDVNYPSSIEFSDEPYLTYQLFSQKNGVAKLQLSENEKVSINTAISTFDKKYRTSLLEQHEVNPNFREVASEAYTYSFKRDVDTLLDCVIGLRTPYLANSYNGRKFINHIAYHMQGLASALPRKEAEDIYDSIFENYDKEATVDLAEAFQTLQPMIHTAPLLETAIRKKLMIIAFGIVDEESLFSIPLSWLIKSTDLNDSDSKQ